MPFLESMSMNLFDSDSPSKSQDERPQQSDPCSINDNEQEQEEKNNRRHLQETILHPETTQVDNNSKPHSSSSPHTNTAQVSSRDIEIDARSSSSIIHHGDHHVHGLAIGNRARKEETETETGTGIAGINHLIHGKEPQFEHESSTSSFHFQKTSSHWTSHHMKEATRMIRDAEDCLDVLNRIQVKNAIVMDHLVMAGAD